MAEAGFSVGTFTGGGTFKTESLSGTQTPIGLVAWGGAGTVTRVTPTTPLPAQVFGGTLNAGTVTVANTGTVTGTVGLSGGTISTIAAGTIAISTIAAGTVVATAAGTQLVSGTVSLSGGTVGLSGGTVAVLQAGTLDKVASGTITTVSTLTTQAMLQAGTLDMLKAGTVQVSGGTVVATAAGTQTVAGTVNVGAGTVNPSIGQGKTLAWGTVNLTSGSVSLVNPGSGTTAYIVGLTLTVGTTGIIQFLQGVGAAALSGPLHVDQYGGFVDRGQPSSPVLKGAQGSQIYLSITSGIGTIGGYYSYFTE